MHPFMLILGGSLSMHYCLHPCRIFVFRILYKCTCIDAYRSIHKHLKSLKHINRCIYFNYVYTMFSFFHCSNPPVMTTATVLGTSTQTSNHSHPSSIPVMTTATVVSNPVVVSKENDHERSREPITVWLSKCLQVLVFCTTKGFNSVFITFVFMRIEWEHFF